MGRFILHIRKDGHGLADLRSVELDDIVSAASGRVLFYRFPFL